ncbi:MAG: hypothetical protein EB829_01115 [Nitrosopumilus sp. H8]|nr:MAG: hypothetical protein EB829_01115 [Nitrosopumilus sp. H8]
MVRTVLFQFSSYLVFLFASLAVSIGAALAIFVVFPFLLRKRYMSRMGGYGSGTGGGFFGMGSQGSSSIKYVCLVCNNKHKGGTCPRCGSKMQRADF